MHEKNKAHRRFGTMGMGFAAPPSHQETIHTAREFFMIMTQRKGIPVTTTSFNRNSSSGEDSKKSVKHLHYVRD